MPDEQMHQTGMNIRKEIFGAEVVERRMSSAGEFGAPLQKFINQYAYGEIWGREALPRKMRSLLAIAMMCAANRPHELRIHLRGAITNGCTQGRDPRGAAAGRDLLRHPRVARRAQHGDGSVCGDERLTRPRVRAALPAMLWLPALAAPAPASSRSSRRFNPAR